MPGLTFKSREVTFFFSSTSKFNQSCFICSGIKERKKIEKVLSNVFFCFVVSHDLGVQIK